jgi:hypothetical protein
VVKVSAIDSSGSREDMHVLYNLPHGILATGYATHTLQHNPGRTFSFNSYGGTVAYTFQRLFLNGLAVSAGVTDGASKEGNTGANFQGGVHYRRRMNRWTVSGHFTYAQTLQTLLRIYTNSTVGYGGGVSRILSHNSRIMFNGGGGRSGVTQYAGLMNHNENFSAFYISRYFGVSGSYSKNYGQTLVTPNGLVNVPSDLPSPLLPNARLAVFNGSGYGVGVSTTLWRRIATSVSYTKGSGYGVGPSLATNYDSEGMNFRLHYHYRKLFGDVGYARLRQDSFTNTSTHSVINSFFIGITRSFSIF